MDERQVMETDIVCVGFGPAMGGFLTTLARGIVNEDGSVYLSGIEPGKQMTVSWGGTERCTLMLPASVPADGLVSALNLLCEGASANDKSPALTPLTDNDTENKHL